MWGVRYSFINGRIAKSDNSMGSSKKGFYEGIDVIVNYEPPNSPGSSIDTRVEVTIREILDHITDDPETDDDHRASE